MTEKKNIITNWTRGPNPHISKAQPNIQPKLIFSIISYVRLNDSHHFNITFKWTHYNSISYSLHNNYLTTISFELLQSTRIENYLFNKSSLNF